MNWRSLGKTLMLVLLAITLTAGLGIACRESTGRGPVPIPADQTAVTEPLDQARTRLLGCLPQPAALPAPPISIRSLARLSARTRVELVVWAEEQPVELRLPLYLSSRGRWLLGDDERVFLIDQECRQYGLQDVEFLPKRISPGTIRIAAREAITGTLIFPPLGSRARFGALVYGQRVLRVLFPEPSPDPAQP
ncbi:MAG: hypothetical protein RIR86_553 [Acidobacteriota bacterium]|jgi:hypothetical protein